VRRYIFLKHQRLDSGRTEPESVNSGAGPAKGNMRNKLIPRAVVLGVFGVIALVLSQLASPAGTQSQGQFPSPPPNAIKYPHDLDSSFIRMPLPSGDEAYGRLQGDHMEDYVKQIVMFSLKDRDEGNLLWGRTAGTDNDVRVEDWVEAKFKEAGLQDVHKQTFDLPPQWFPTSWSLTATGSGQTLTFKTLRASGTALPAGGLDLECVWVGLGTKADFAGRDVKGKLAVIWSQPTPGVISNSAGWMGSAKRAADEGAAAVLINLALPGNYEIQVAPNPNSANGLPTFTMGTDDTNALRGLMEKGPVKVHAEYAMEMRSGLRDSSVWGILPGMTDEDIVVFAHHDAVFTGALDNASGMAVMVGLAEYFSKIPKEQRRRTIKFVTTAGHHNGSFGTKWMHDNRSTFLAKTALMINCEHVSVAQTYYWGPTLRQSDGVDARRWWIYGSSELASIVLRDWNMFGVTIYDTMEPGASGDGAWVAADAPMVQMIESPASYHTNMPEIVPAAGLEAVARSYAKIIDDVNKVDRSDLLEIAPGSGSESRSSQ
jgi:hypothetical protein